MFACITGLNAISFAQNFVTKIYTASDGLPDASINTIYQASKGYLWLGTRTSLCRFDGYRFVDYGKTLSDSSFTGSVMLEDHLHRFWVSTDKGLGVLKNKKLVYFPTTDGFKIGWIYSLKELSDGRIWAMCDKGLYELRDTIWQKLNLVKEYKDEPCRFAVESPNGIYLSYGWQLFLCQKNGFVKPITPKQNDYPFYVWLKKYNEQVYVNTMEGIYKIIGDSLVRIFQKQINGIYSYDFLVDSKKRTWISTDEYGVMVSDPGNETELTHKIPLPFNQTLLFTEDREGNVWASNYEGLLKVKDDYSEVFNRQQSPLLEDIRHLTLKSNGEILIKSALNGFITYNGQNFSEDRDFALANQTLRKAVVDVSVNDEKGNTWMVTRSGDLFKTSKSGAEHINKKLKNEWFLCLAYDSSSKTVYASGKKIYASHGGSLTELPCTNAITPRRIYCSHQNLIVYTRDSGVYMITPQSKIQHLTQLWSANNSYRDFQLFNDPDGGFWTTSFKDGLQKWYWYNNQPVKQLNLSANDGLPNTFVVTATFDRQHRMWLATLSGLVIIEKNQSGTYTVNRIDEGASFRINNWDEARLATDKNGIVWLSSFHDIIRFHTDHLYFDKATPNIAINEVLLNLAKTDWIKWTDSLEGIHQIPRFVKLPYNKNTISVSFDAITFSQNEQSLFSYKLEGLNTNWQRPTNIRSVSFVNLAPGRYTFLVRVRKPNTAWSAPAQFSFVIRPPYWSAWWFQSLMALFAAAVLTLFFRLRISRIKNKALLQQQIQELDVKALKATNALMTARQKMTDAEMQALRAQMNPHFIYNALNSIQSLVLDNLTQEAIRYIGKFAKLLRQVLEHSDNNLITLEKELSTLELYIQLEALRMNATLHYEIEVDEQLMPEKELVPPLIIQPYVENALWHGLSRKKAERKLWVTVSASEEWLFVKIRDNGIGRQQAALHKQESGINVPSKGMSITADRLALMNGDTNETAVSILDLYDEAQRSKGTEVTLRIARVSKP